MGRQRLDKALLEKLEKQTGKKRQYIREQIAKKANKIGVSSEAYLVVWAKQLGIGTAMYQRSLSHTIQAEIRDVLPIVFGAQSRPSMRKNKEKKILAQASKISLAIEYLIGDDELLSRCKDLLKAKKNFDRVFREATTVLEDRIKKLSGLRRMRPTDLVGKAINPDPTKAILKVSDDHFEQQGFHSICKGIILSFRDTTHHELTNKFQREDALKFCGFVDSLLAILDKAEKKEVT
jgi:hypothetical protein